MMQLKKRIEELHNRYLEVTMKPAKIDDVAGLQRLLESEGIVTKWSNTRYFARDAVAVAHSLDVGEDVDRLLREIAEFLDASYGIVVTTEEWGEASVDGDVFAVKARALGLKLKNEYIAFMELARNNNARAYLYFKKLPKHDEEDL